MTNLQGTEKQIAWAEEIKAKFIEDTEAKLADLQSDNPTYRPAYIRAYGEDWAEANMKRDITDLKAALQIVDNITDASDWIDGRRNLTEMIGRRADFCQAKQTILDAEKPKKTSPNGPRKSILEMLAERN